MNNGLVHIGFGNLVAVGRIVAISAYKSAPLKRLVNEARDTGRALDLAGGRRVKSVIYTDADYLVLSALDPSTVSNRINET